MKIECWQVTHLALSDSGDFTCSPSGAANATVTVKVAVKKTISFFSSRGDSLAKSSWTLFAVALLTSLKWHGNASHGEIGKPKSFTYSNFWGTRKKERFDNNWLQGWDFENNPSPPSSNSGSSSGKRSRIPMDSKASNEDVKGPKFLHSRLGNPLLKPGRCSVKVLSIGCHRVIAVTLLPVKPVPPTVTLSNWFLGQIQWKINTSPCHLFNCHM